MEDEASELRNIAASDNLRNASITTVGSVVSLAFVVFGSFLAWNIFKRRYYRSVLGKKPEVCVHES